MTVAWRSLASRIRRRAPVASPPAAATVMEAGRSALPQDLQLHALEAFEALADADQAERAEWFARMGAEDPALATQVALLLRADAEAGKVLPTQGPSLASHDAEDEPGPPARIGPYSLGARLGRGGMGDVYLGERDDGLFDQKVAIKVIRSGRLSPLLAARFAEERRILARLSHPHIAQLFDGGVDAMGRSYFVMELLEGRTITDYVREEALGLNAILELFLDVCSAVQFAHQNLVVHADIKPNNIIVTPQSGVKLLDFGIATLIEPGADPRGPATAHEPMTRAYAAPERLVGAPSSVSGDVYALGALLFEMLCGRLPASLSDESDETRAVSAVGPSSWPTPSEALRRQGERGQVLASQVAGDIDAIVGRALSLRASDRYTSVLELSDDIVRFRGHQPVRARPAEVGYVVSKFVRRHRLGLGVTAAAMLTLAVTAGTVTKLYLDSEHLRARAVARFGETRAMANYMMFEADPQLARLPGSLGLRQDMVSRSQRYLQALASDPSASPDLRLEIAEGYFRLARIYAFDLNGGLGDVQNAKAALEEGRRMLAALSPGSVDSVRLDLLRGDAEMIAGNSAFLAPDASSLSGGLGALERAQAWYGAALSQQPSNVRAALGLWRAQVMSGRLLSYLQKNEQAVDLIGRHLDDRRPAPTTRAEMIEANFIRTGALLILAEDLEEMHQYGRSFAMFQRLNDEIDAIRKSGMAGSENDYMQSTALAALGRDLARRHQFEPAIDRYRQSLELMRRILSFGPNDAVDASLSQESVGLSHVLTQAGRYEDADAILREEVAKATRRIEADPDDTSKLRLAALYLSAEADNLHAAGRKAQACAADRRALRYFDDIQRRSGLLPMDTGPTGVATMVRKRVSGCPS